MVLYIVDFDQHIIDFICCDSSKCIRKGGNWLKMPKSSKNNEQPGTGKIYRG